MDFSFDIKFDDIPGQEIKTDFCDLVVMLCHFVVIVLYFHTFYNHLGYQIAAEIGLEASEASPKRYAIFTTGERSEPETVSNTYDGRAKRARNGEQYLRRASEASPKR